MLVHQLPVPGILAQCNNRGEKAVSRSQIISLEGILTTADVGYIE